MKLADYTALQGLTMNADMSAADGQAQANGSGRLRAWSGKLGSQINTLKSRVGPNADQVTSTLRGLFQRQGSQDGQRYMHTTSAHASADGRNGAKFKVHDLRRVGVMMPRPSMPVRPCTYSGTALLFCMDCASAPRISG